MKLKDKLRLALLVAKGATATPTEVTEIETLKSAFKAAGFSDDAVKGIINDFKPEDGEEVDPSELETLIGNAVKAAVGNGANSAAIAAEIVKATEGKALTTADVEGVVRKHAPQAVNVEDIVKQVVKAVPVGLTEQGLAAAFDRFAAQIKTPSRAGATGGSDQGSLDFPFEHRSGNLDVAGRQLLSLCLAGLPDGAKRKIKAAGGQVPGDMNEGITAAQLSYAEKRGIKMLEGFRQFVSYGVRSLTTGGSGTGAELIPSDLSSALQARMYLRSQLASELLASEIQMPTDPFRFPMRTTRTPFTLGVENTATAGATTGGNPGTQGIVLDTAKFVGIAGYSREADEDAIVALLPMLQDDMAQGAADAFEGGILNGDTTANHMDTDIRAVSLHASKGFKGLRKYANAGSLRVDCSTGGVSFTNLKAILKLTAKYGINTADLRWVFGPLGYNDVRALPETLTADKVGTESARILTGNAPSVLGIPILVSSQQREDLNASAVYDGSTTTKGSFALFHKPSLIVGVRRDFTVEVQEDKVNQVNLVVASFRRAFTPKETPSTTEPMLALGYNYNAAA